MMNPYQQEQEKIKVLRHFLRTAAYYERLRRDMQALADKEDRPEESRVRYQRDADACSWKLQEIARLFLKFATTINMDTELDRYF